MDFASMLVEQRTSLHVTVMKPFVSIMLRVRRRQHTKYTPSDKVRSFVCEDSRRHRKCQKPLAGMYPCRCLIYPGLGIDL